MNAKKPASQAIAQDNLVDDGILTVRSAADWLKISRAKLYALMAAGELVYIKIGRCRRVPKRALTEFAKRALVNAGAAK